MTTPKPSLLQKFFGKSKSAKVNENMPNMSVKGDKAFGSGSGSASRGTAGGGGKGSMHFHPEVSPGNMERQLYAIDKGPRMLPRAARFRVWGALLGIGGWFAGCFALVAYRLRSDDLELMEREVYEELKTKKEVKRFQ